MFYIDNNEDLISICKEIKEKSNMIAMDTEFTKRTEYFPTLSIIQISYFNGEIIKDCIIDIQTEKINLKPFFEILNDGNIKKIFHSCSQDLEALYRISGKIPSPIEDTQLMAAFSGMRINMGYCDLIKETLKIVVKKNKKIQEGCWTKRPLTEEQLNYAIGDVNYLLEMYMVLAQKLDQNKSFKYYRSDIEERYGRNMLEKVVEDSWRKMRFKLGNRTNIYMEEIKEMCRLREKIAMQNNLIKNLIMPDNFLKILISKKPRNIADLNEIFEGDKEISIKSRILKRRFIKAYTKALNRAKNQKLEEKSYIVELKDKVMIQKLNEINDYIISECKKLGIAPELVQNKVDLSSYISDSEKLEDLFEKWKIDLFGDRIKEIKER